jgi:hypothetical protein
MNITRRTATVGGLSLLGTTSMSGLSSRALACRNSVCDIRPCGGGFYRT